MNETSFSRADPGRQFVEIRPLVPVEVVAVIDAVAIELGVDRTSVVKAWLRDRAVQEHRKATLIVNTSRGHPSLSDTES